MRHTKAQEMPYAAIIKALIVLTAGLLIFLVVSSGFLQKAIKEWLGQTDVILGDEQSGDYILRAGLEELTGSNVTLHITPNPLRCGEIRHPDGAFIIKQASVESVDVPDDAFEEIGKEDVSEDCDSKTVTVTLSDTDPLRTHVIRLEVWGEENTVLETLDFEVPMWGIMLRRYLDSPMAELGMEYEGVFALMWSYNMHRDPGPTIFDDHPKEQSLDLGQGQMDEVVDFFGIEDERRAIEDVSGLFEGTFRDFLVKLACTYPEGNSGGRGVKENAFQIVVTGLFGDLQDFDGVSGKPPTEGQPVPRVRDGTGARGWDQDATYRNQLLPTMINVWYPGMQVGGNLAWNPGAMVRSRDTWWTEDEAFYDEREIYLPADGEMEIEGPEGSCLKGKTFMVSLRVCPEIACGIGG